MSGNQKSSQQNEKQKEKQKEKQYIQTEQDVKLTFYSASAMIAVLVAAVTTVLSMVILAKPAYYVLESRAGGSNDELSLTLMEDYVFRGANADKLFGTSIAISALCAIATILTIVVIIRALDPLKKPSMLFAGSAFVADLAALIVYISSRISSFRIVDEYFADMPDDIIEATPKTGMYDYCFAAVIINAVVLIIMVIGVGTGRMKWDKNGKTC